MGFLFLETWIWILVAFILGIATGLLLARQLQRRYDDRVADAVKNHEGAAGRHEGAAGRHEAPGSQRSWVSVRRK